ncbi:hypothetical protein Agabi119p4_2545 [Agaricus bisporus var. burnettii]|uniref:Uncharacterized protein n=1 Tax=Agaricus bisporus var. burnettii TaxID=192524 RepID=A0A8H7F9E3_AGABI|nr:hypothetical protein Agabi119p4_2545 [Agaricus bisporus var. burnettii]
MLPGRPRSAISDLFVIYPPQNLTMSTTKCLKPTCPSDEWSNPRSNAEFLLLNLDDTFFYDGCARVEMWVMKLRCYIGWLGRNLDINVSTVDATAAIYLERVLARTSPPLGLGHYHYAIRRQIFL